MNQPSSRVVSVSPATWQPFHMRWWPHWKWPHWAAHGWAFPIVQQEPAAMPRPFPEGNRLVQLGLQLFTNSSNTVFAGQNALHTLLWWALLAPGKLIPWFDQNTRCILYHGASDELFCALPFVWILTCFRVETFWSLQVGNSYIPICMWFGTPLQLLGCPCFF